ADGFHMAEMGEGPQAIEDAGAELMRHCHIANPDGRTYPQPDDAWDYAPFFASLKRIGYTGGVSIEAGCDDFARRAKLAFETLDPLRR
ncbi:MAG: hypothetical protein ACI4L8_11975, partial [Candidatus Fimadaptatus sp.]